MYFVYALQNQMTGKTYIGQTADLVKRLQRHNGALKAKSNSFTAKGKGFWKYIYIETCPSRNEALKREKQLKSAQGRAFIKKHGSVAQLVRAAAS